MVMQHLALFLRSQLMICSEAFEVLDFPTIFQNLVQKKLGEIMFDRRGVRTERAIASKPKKLERKFEFFELFSGSFISPAISVSYRRKYLIFFRKNFAKAPKAPCRESKYNTGS